MCEEEEEEYEYEEGEDEEEAYEDVEWALHTWIIFYINVFFVQKCPKIFELLNLLSVLQYV